METDDIKNLRHDLAMARAHSLAITHFVQALVDVLGRDMPGLPDKLKASLAVNEQANSQQMPWTEDRHPALDTYAQGIADLCKSVFGATHPPA